MRKVLRFIGIVLAVIGAVMFAVTATALPDSIRDIFSDGDFDLFGKVVVGCILWGGLGVVGIKLYGD